MKYVYLFFDGTKFYPKAFSNADLAFSELERMKNDLDVDFSKTSVFGSVIRLELVDV